MKNSLTLYALIMMFFTIISINGCSNKDNPVTPVGPENNTISGEITFVDTNFITTGGKYNISAFPNPSVPPTYWFGPPTSFDTLVIFKESGVYKARYTLKSVSNGSYVVAVGFRKDTGGQSPIMGVYGCDTARSSNGSMCFLNPTRVNITDNAGVTGINFLSWADTTKKVY
ncbi:MAG TPA: hypothetical protein DEP28_05510 [Bacteroidetes bacterium]|nr:hypothetical protein [Bacteroidota bacterium]HCN36967.1 hypothetical protein [Bacteroidota bacterium]